MVRQRSAPRHWRTPCANSEAGLHQLSPYIGKLKSTIAADLVGTYSRPGDTVVDPFAGAGTVPLEALRQGRNVFASDINPYARILSVAKLRAPRTLNEGILVVEKTLAEASCVPRPDLRSVPAWVRRFFHPDTLRDALQFAEIGRTPGHEFAMACFLGILHHQRPGFLSFPSSHLVPYLRDQKYPRSSYPELYTYRAIAPRLLAKVHRVFKRPAQSGRGQAVFRQSPIARVTFPQSFDAVITSPPYMNALDYNRDNRLRLWFIDPTLPAIPDTTLTRRRAAFQEAIAHLARRIETGLTLGGYCVMVVGQVSTRSYKSHPADTVKRVFAVDAPSLRLETILSDKIPDVRRARRSYRGVKSEEFLIYRRQS